MLPEHRLNRSLDPCSCSGPGPPDTFWQFAPRPESRRPRAGRSSWRSGPKRTTEHSLFPCKLDGRGRVSLLLGRVHKPRPAKGESGLKAKNRQVLIFQ